MFNATNIFLPAPYKIIPAEIAPVIATITASMALVRFLKSSAFTDQLNIGAKTKIKGTIAAKTPLTVIETLAGFILLANNFGYLC